MIYETLDPRCPRWVLGCLGFHRNETVSLRKLLTGARATQLGRFSRDVLNGRRTPVGDWFLPGHHQRVALWEIVTSTLRSHPQSRPTATKLVGALAILCDSTEVTMEDDAEQVELVLPDLSAEIRKLGTVPVAAGNLHFALRVRKSLMKWNRGILRCLAWGKVREG